MTSYRHYNDNERSIIIVKVHVLETQDVYAYLNTISLVLHSMAPHRFDFC